MKNHQESATASLLLRGASVVLPHGVSEDSVVLVEGGRITRVSASGEQDSARAEQTLDLSGLTLYPGFIDLHIHGAVGMDAMAASADDLHAVALYLASKGVTAWLPTFVPAPEEDYARAVEAVEGLMRRQDELPSAARALGLHYEGPFVNVAQCGALHTEHFRTFSEASSLDTLPLLALEGARHMMTVAPETEGGVELIRELCARGWIVSIGHTRADLFTLDLAAEAGARHMTHFLNAMSPLHQRAPGPVGWGLVRDDVTCDLIADGVHSDPLMLRLVLRCKGAERVALISDAVSPAGLGDGDYSVWGETIKVTEGRTANARGSIAGSVSDMSDGVRMLRTLGLPAHEIASTASRNPARLLGLSDTCGSIEAGKRADLAALDDEGRVRLTIIGGRIAHSDLS